MGAVWSFRSSGRAAIRDDPKEPFPALLERALRHAPSGVGTLRWTIETGPKGRALLFADTPGLTRWVDTLLLPQYPAGRWVPVDPPRPSGLPRWSAMAWPDPAGPFPSARDGHPPWIDAVLSMAPSIGRSLTLSATLRPSGTPSPRRETETRTELIRQPLGFRSLPPPLEVRNLADRLDERRIGSQWRVTAELLGPSPEPGTPEGLAEWAALVGTASRRDGGSGLRFRPVRRWLDWAQSPIVWSSAEVAMILPSPRCRYLPFVDDRPVGSVPLVIGRTLGGRTAHLWVEPGQGRHLAVLGETGMGKSTLLVRLATQVIRGAGVVLLDPIGDTARRFLGALPPATRPRVLWVSPRESPVAINALASVTPGPSAGLGKRDRTIDDLVAALRRVRESRFGDAPFWGPRIEETVRRALIAASALPNGTVLEAEQLLSSPGRNIRGVPPEAQPWVQQLRERVLERPEEVDGARRLLGEISGSEVLRRMLCEPRARSSVEGWVAPGRITVISGDAVEVGETAARYLLSVHLALLWPELLARSPASKTVVILDEAQWYAHETAAEILRLGRRQNVHLWIATQALASLSEAVAEAIRTNAADFVVFRGSPEEARLFHRWLPDVTEESLLSLGAGQALVLSGKGEEVQWASLERVRAATEDSRAIDEVRSGSRPHWPAPSDPDGPSGGSEPSPGVRAGSTELDPAVREILLVLWAGVQDDDRSEGVTVGLPALRAVLDPGGRVLRTVGGILQRSGALDDRIGGPAGRGWRLKGEPFRTLFPGEVDAAEIARARLRWREVAAWRGPSG